MWSNFVWCLDCKKKLSQNRQHSMINITNNFSHMSYCACVLYSNQIDWVIIDQGTYSLGEIHYTAEKIVCALLDWGKFYDLYLQNETPYTFFNHFTYCEPASSSNQNDWYIIAQGKYSCREVHYKYEEHVGSITWCMSIWWFVISKSGNIYFFFLMPHIASYIYIYIYIIYYMLIL